MTSTGEQQTQERAQAYPKPTTVGRTTGGGERLLTVVEKALQKQRKTKKVKK